MVEKIVVKYTKPTFHLYQASETRKEEGKMSVDLKPRTEAADSHCHKSGRTKVHSLLAQAGNESIFCSQSSQLTPRLGLRQYSPIFFVLVANLFRKIPLYCLAFCHALFH